MNTPAMEQTKPAVSAGNSWDIDPILTVEHLTMRFGGLVAVNDLSFNVGRGDITALIGPNGAGKTTVFNCVTGFYKPTEGRTVMRHGPGQQTETVDVVTASGLRYGQSANGSVFLLERMPDFEISQIAKVARTFQNIRLFGGMTVLENLLVAQHNALMKASAYTIGGIFGIPGFKKAEKAAIEKAKYWLEHVNLIERADDPAADLPYGAQRRLEIARAMCTDPQLLCLDEPAAGLNPRESAELNSILQFIRQEGTSILLIEHDMGVVMEISDHIVVLDYGVKISDGPAEAVKTDPKVIAAYLGVDDEAEIDVPEIKQDVEEVVRAEEEPTAKKTAAARKPAAKKKAAAPATALKAAADPGDHPGTRPGGLEAPRSEGADNLTMIKGVGPASEKKLNALGIWHFDQVAAWKKKEVEWVGSYLAFPGRIEREEWVKQAKTLAKGGATAFSKRVAKGEVPTSRASKPASRGKGGKA